MEDPNDQEDLVETKPNLRSDIEKEMNDFAQLNGLRITYPRYSMIELRRCAVCHQKFSFDIGETTTTFNRYGNPIGYIMHCTNPQCQSSAKFSEVYHACSSFGLHKNRDYSRSFQTNHGQANFISCFYSEKRGQFMLEMVGDGRLFYRSLQEMEFFNPGFTINFISSISWPFGYSQILRKLFEKEEQFNQNLQLLNQVYRDASYLSFFPSDVIKSILLYLFPF